VNCPACGETKTEVLETRRALVGNEVQRRHECGCGVRWLSVQRLVRGSMVSLRPLPTAYPSTTGSDSSESRNDSVSPVPPSDPGSLIRSDPDLSKLNPGKIEGSMSAAPPVLTFPVDGKAREFHVTAKLFAIHSQGFPSLDVMGEYRKALAWVQSNPERRKTARGMPTFLFRWLSGAQDRGRANGNARQHALPKL
jgi:hypothetical protein